MIELSLLRLTSKKLKACTKSVDSARTLFKPRTVITMPRSALYEDAETQCIP